MKYQDKDSTLYCSLFLLLIAAFVLFKREALTLPFFWDEAWVYMPAIRTMAEQGPSIIPGSIAADLHTGHPLLFYFLASTWIKFWGYSLPVAHSFPLLISACLLISMYYIALQWTSSHFAAFLSALLLAVQPIFLTQSTYMLIEVWLSLLVLWTFYFYFEKNLICFAITLLMALWSKESPYCLIPCFMLVAIVEFFLMKTTRKELFGKIAVIGIVFLLGFSFFILQKILAGWFFFPAHINLITLSAFTYKFHLALNILFHHQGRSVFFIGALIACAAGHIVFKHRFSSAQWLKLISILIFTFGGILFASINFFSARYLLGAIPLLMLGCGLLYGSINSRYYAFALLAGAAIYGGFNIYQSCENKIFSDVELSYTRLLKAQVQMVDHLEKNPPKEKIYAPFLMHVNLNNPYAGFVKQGISNLSSDIGDSSNVYYLALPNEHEPVFDRLQKDIGLQLVYRAENKQARVDLYKKK